MIDIIVFESIPCKYGHNEGRYIRNRTCVVCDRERSKKIRNAPGGKEKHLEANKRSRKKIRAERPLQSRFYEAKHRANKSGLEFSMIMSDLHQVDICPYLGVPLNYFNKFDDYTATIDRIDSTKGYVSGNVEIISHRANRIKNDGTWQEHALISKRLKQLTK